MSGESAFDCGAVETNDAFAVDFGDWHGGNVGHGRGVNFLIFNSLLFEPIHEGVAINTGFGGIYFNHVYIIAY